jgi:hypothetical protein
LPLEVVEVFHHMKAIHHDINTWQPGLNRSATNWQSRYDFAFADLELAVQRV